ncbi:uncharacterized protein Bfra_011813, partial [Botrytis fragariae]
FYHGNRLTILQVERSSKLGYSYFGSLEQAGDASVLEYILNVEIPRLRTPPEDVAQFFQSFTTANDKQPPPTTTKARTKKLDLIKPKQTFNRVQKQKREKPARATGIKSYIILLKSQEKEGFPLGSDGQPPFVRFPVALLLNSSPTFKHLVEAKRQRIFDARGDKVCYNL